MKVAVLVKAVPDTATELRVNDSNVSIIDDDFEYVVNPYDEYAIEEAIRLKEAFSGEVIAVSLGGDTAVKVLRAALAMGADRAILVREPDPDRLTGRGTARVLAELIRGLSADLVFAGKQAIDDDGSQVPERMAEILGLSHASSITRFSLDGCTALADCEIEGGHYTVELPLPALFTTQKGINNPRYPALPAVLKARRAPIEEVSLKDLGIGHDEIEPGIRVDSIEIPVQKRLGKIITQDSVGKVKELASVILEKVRP
ncbi:MAG TPA: electron transfer flavoprotein subunit beta/FixA family protein [Geobacteraceae bacterium]|nr:electron transfer flavoprotein subunit beta/FixA family protein [Geobacteraceae bacterium]